MLRSTAAKRVGGSLLLVALASSAGCRPRLSAEVIVLNADRALEVSAVVNAAGFSQGEMAGYHLIVWKGGAAAEAALFQVAASDSDILDALEALGAVAGDALDIDTWEQRNDDSSREPDRVVEGPPLEIFVRPSAAGELLRLSEILEDEGGAGFEMRFGGHRANIPKWRSGCVTCLYSCPGGKTGNARYTVRDFVRGTTRFRVRPGVLPEDGRPVTLRFQLG